ncbi:MAG: hypothetical protein HZB76_00800 [Chlamydiae bacterium]|nr:hypothetical protein [Chlamydiota bacterium]
MASAVFRITATKSVEEHVIELQRIWRKKHRVGKIKPEAILKAWSDLAASVKRSELNKAPLFINILPIDQKNPLFAKTQETLHRWINELEQIRAAIYAGHQKSIENLDWALIISRTLLSTLEEKTWQTLKNTFLQVVFDNEEIQAIVIYSFDKDEDTNEEIINIHHLCTAPQNLERGNEELADLINPDHKKIVKGAAIDLCK